MNTPQESQTNLSLLLRLRNNDHDPHAWQDFVERYGRRIYEWCLNRRLQPADAEDVTQNVLVKLAKQLGSFDYQARLTFRGWLRRITENAVTDFFRECKRREFALEGNRYSSLLDDAAAPVDLATRISNEFDLEVFEIAKLNVRSRIEARRWEAWELTAVHQWEGADVAEKLEMRLPTVYSSRYQVQNMIAAEVQKLNTTTEDLFNVGSSET